MTTDEIKLPPLPPYDRITHEATQTRTFWDEDSMHAYARAAVTEDRAQRASLETALQEWADKTEWVQQTCQPKELGMHRADILKARIAELEANRHKWMCIADERAVAVADLRVKLAEAQKDSARLDWLEHQNAILESDAWTVLGHDCTAEEGFRKYWVGANLRSAIDAAMEAKP